MKSYVIAATILSGLLVTMMAQPVELPPLPAVRLPIAATLHADAVMQQDPNRVPDEGSSSHYHRPDGQACRKDGPGACHCQVICPSADSENPTYSESSQCQWWCHKEKCTCHHCPELECSEQ